MRLKTRFSAGALVLALIGSAGCAGIEPGGDDPPPSSESPSSQSPTPDSSPSAGSAPSGGEVPGQPSGPAVASERGVYALRLGELRRTSSSTLTANFTIATTTSEIQMDSNAFNEDRQNADLLSVDGAYLTDERGGKKYLVLQDAQNFCICSRNLGGFDANETKTLFAKFPAPPPDVKTISVTIKGFPSIDNVPIVG